MPTVIVNRQGAEHERQHALQGPHSPWWPCTIRLRSVLSGTLCAKVRCCFPPSYSLGSCVTSFESRVAIKLRTIRRNLWHADSKNGYRGRFRKREDVVESSLLLKEKRIWFIEHGALPAAHFGHQMVRDQDLVPSRLRTFEFQHWNQCLQLGRDASGGWLVWVGMYGYFSLSTNLKAREMC